MDIFQGALVSMSLLTEVLFNHLELLDTIVPFTK